MEALVVRPARLDDLDRIVQLRMALLHEYAGAPLYSRLRPDVEDRARDLYLAQLVASHETMFLAERARRVVGILRCVETVGSPLMFPDKYCYVSSVYVVPAERRRGVLRALLGAAERWCDNRGLGEMRLHNAASADVAAEVWESFGFEVVEQVRRRIVPGAHADDRAVPEPAHAGKDGGAG